MNRLPSFVTLLALVCMSAIGQAQTPASVLIQLTVGRNQTVTGQLGRENETHIEVLNLANGRKVIFEKTKVASIKRDLTEDEVKQAVGLAKVVAWRVRRVTPDAKQDGTVIDVQGRTVFVNLTAKNKITEGQQLDIFKVTGDLKDPTTGKVIGKKRDRIGRLVVTRVQEDFSETRVGIGDARRMAKGDAVSPVVRSNAIAILPMVDVDGNETLGGQNLAEELTTGLVNHGVPVVERTLLSKAIGELALQSTRLFDSLKAQRLGKQIGAFAVLAGTTSPTPSGSIRTQLRLVDVATGKILFATSHDFAGDKFPMAVVAPAAAGDASGGGAVVGGRWYHFRRGSRWPSFLEPNGSLTRDGISGKGTIVHTRKGDYLDKNFRLELVFTLPTDGHIMVVGFGEGRRDTAVKLRIHSPGNFLGDVGFGKPGVKERPLESGKRITSEGPHRLSITKIGDELTFEIDHDNDGPSPDDIERTVPNVREYAPFLHNKNSYIYFRNGGIYKQVRMTYNPRPTTSDGAATTTTGTSTPTSTSSSAASSAGRTGAFALKSGHPWPTFMNTGGKLTDTGLRTLSNYISTREADFINRDFEFEVVFTVDEEDVCSEFGIGPATGKKHVLVRIFSDKHRFKGAVGLWRFGARGSDFGNIPNRGPHRVIISKKKDTLTFTVDVGNDRSTSNDLIRTIPNLKKVASYLNDTNAWLYFGNGGTFQGVKLTDPAIKPVATTPPKPTSPKPAPAPVANTRKPDSNLIHKSVFALTFEEKTFAGTGNERTIRDAFAGEASGKVVGATTVPGLIGDALSFDGDNDYLETTLRPSQVGAISMWIQMRQKSSGTSTIFGRNGDFTGFTFYPVPEKPERMRLVYGNGQAWKMIVFEHQMKRGNWHHLVAVFDRRLSRFSFVLDGKAIHGEQMEKMAGLDDLQFRIGAPNQHSFHGLIDEVLVFNRGLSLSEIQQLYNHGKAGKSLVD